MLIVEPLGGLGNRMRALDGARPLARALGRKLTVIWQVEDVFGASFSDLFEPLDGIDAWHEFDCRTEAGEMERARFLAAARPDISFDFIKLHFALLDGLTFDSPRFRDYRVIHIETLSRIFPTEKPYADFRLKPHLRQRVEAVTSAFDATMGVHVRRTDSNQAIAFSPTPAFIARMRQATEQGEARSFFVATDDPGEERALAAAFPGKIITQPKRSLDRSKREAIEDAVVDLYTLAATTKVLGSFSSTYSEAAAALGGVPLENVMRPWVPASKGDNPAVITFGIPVKRVNDPAEFRFRSRMLSATLASIYAQTDGAFHIIVAGVHPYDIDIPLDDRFEYLQVDTKQPKSLSDTFTVIGQKMERIAERHLERGGGHLMLVDMDDFVSKRLVEFARANPDPNGYLIDRGYIMNARSNTLIETDQFDRKCGTSAIMHLVRGEVGGYGVRFAQLRVGGHVTVGENSIAAGRPLKRVPFPGAIWVLNHGSNVTWMLRAAEDKRMDGPQEMLKEIEVRGAPSSEVADDFAVPARYPIYDDYLAAAGRRPPPTLSVTIVTHRRPEGLRRLLAALVPQIQSKSNREIVVVNDGTHDDAYEAVRVEFDAVIKYRALPTNVGVAKARNASAELARGDYLVFTDDDCEPPPWWLDWLEAQLRWSPDLDVVAGLTRPMKPARRTFFSDVQAGHNFLPTASRSASGFLFATANVAIRRDLFWKLGGFGFPGAFHGASEDTDLAARLARAGAAGCIDTSWFVAHEVSSGFAAARRRYWRYGYANATLMRLTTAPQALDGLAGHRRRLGLRDWLVEYRRQRPLAQRVSRHRIVQVLSTLLAMLVSMAYFDGAAAALRDRDRRRVTFSA